jgi:hypothetical protein
MVLVLLIALFLSPQGINSSHPNKMSERTARGSRKTAIANCRLTQYLGSRIGALGADSPGREIKYALEIVEGLENAPSAILKLFDGNKKGKLLVKVSEEPS